MRPDTTPRATRYVKTLSDLAVLHNSETMKELADSVKKDWVHEGIELTLSDEDVILQTAADTFKEESK